MLKVCRQAGCYAKSDGTYCQKHRWNNAKTETRKAYDANRADDPLRRLYRDRRWAATRIQVLRRDPLCTIGVICGGRKASNIAHHSPLTAREIVAQFGKAEFFNPSRSQGCCKEDHDRVTAREDSRFAKVSKAEPPSSVPRF